MSRWALDEYQRRYEEEKQDRRLKKAAKVLKDLSFEDALALFKYQYDVKFFREITEYIIERNKDLIFTDVINAIEKIEDNIKLTLFDNSPSGLINVDKDYRMLIQIDKERIAFNIIRELYAKNKQPEMIMSLETKNHTIYWKDEDDRTELI